VAAAKAKYILEAEDRTALAVKKAKAGFNGLKKTAGSLGGVLGALGAGLIFTKVIKATIRQENALRQLEARLKSTKDVVGLSSEQIEKFAGSLQKLTTFGDEAIIEMQNLLLSATNIRGGVFKDATKAVLNMSVALKQDLRTSALAVAKALNDPVQGLTALGRANIKFTDSQKALIKSLVDEGKVAEAQRIILNKLETSFGGAAVAAADTFGGSLDQLGNAFGDLLEQKDGLNDAKESIQELTKTLQDPAVSRGLNKLLSGVVTFVGYMARIGSEVTNAVSEIGTDAARMVSGPLNGLSELQAKLEFFKNLKGSTVFNRTRILGPDGIIKVYDQQEIDAQITKLESQIKEKLQQLHIKQPKITPISDNPTGQAFNLDIGHGKGNPPADTGSAIAAASLAKKYDAALLAMQRAKVAIGETTKYERTLWEVQKGRYKDLSDQQKKSLLDATRSIDQKKAQITAEKKATDDQKKAYQTLADAERQRVTSIKDIIASLQKEADTYGKTSGEIALYNLQQEHASAKDIAAAKKAIDRVKSLKEHTQALSDLQNVIDSVDPNAALVRQLEDLDKLMKLFPEHADVIQEAMLNVNEQMDAMGDHTKKAVGQFDQFAIQASREMQSQFANFLFDPFDKGLDGMVRGFATTVQRMVAELASQQLLKSFFSSLAGGAAAGSGGFGGFLATIAANIKHAGGMAGTGPTRQVPAMAFAGAPRYHAGGIAGLNQNEIPAILQRGEQVLARNDPRNAANGGGQQSISIALVDSRKSYENYLASNAGGKSVLMHIQKNAKAVKRLLT